MFCVFFFLSFFREIHVVDNHLGEAILAYISSICFLKYEITYSRISGSSLAKDAFHSNCHFCHYTKCRYKEGCLYHPYTSFLPMIMFAYFMLVFPFAQSKQ